LGGGGRDLYTKAGEVANLRQRLVGFEKDIAKLRDEKHTLLQQQQASGRGSAPGPGAGSSRDAARAKELEKEVATIRSKLEFRDNDNQKMIRWKMPAHAASRVCTVSLF
jgi:hypothetical protein